MKQGIHPDYREVVFQDEDAGFAFLTRSTIKTKEKIEWEDIKHIVISLINDFYSSGKEFVIDKSIDEKNKSEFVEIERQIIKILDTKIKPAVARDGGDIKFKEFKNGVVTVQLQGSCSGCPSSTMTVSYTHLTLPTTPYV